MHLYENAPYDIENGTSLNLTILTKLPHRGKKTVTVKMQTIVAEYETLEVYESI